MWRLSHSVAARSDVIHLALMLSTKVLWTYWQKMKADILEWGHKGHLDFRGGFKDKGKNLES